MSHPAASISATEAFFASPEQAHFARQWTAGYVDELRNPGGMEEYPLSNAQALKLRKLFEETAEQRGTKFTFGEDEESPPRLASPWQLRMTMRRGTALIDLEASWTPSWRMRWARRGLVSQASVASIRTGHSATRLTRRRDYVSVRGQRDSRRGPDIRLWWRLGEYRQRIALE
jgi:hypothetical protein